MSGESRFCYHSVPRMIEHTVPQLLLSVEATDEDWDNCCEYIKDARINMNCRQVRIVQQGLSTKTS